MRKFCRLDDGNIIETRELGDINPIVVDNIKVRNPLVEDYLAGGWLEFIEPDILQFQTITDVLIMTDTTITYEVINKSDNELIDMLWNAAHIYEYSQINGAAIGMVTIGIILNKPKANAVSQWINSIWTLYYQRKAMILVSGTFTTDMLDFSQCGIMPHDIPELMIEGGYA